MLLTVVGAGELGPMPDCHPTTTTQHTATADMFGVERIFCGSCVTTGIVGRMSTIIMCAGYYDQTATLHSNHYSLSDIRRTHLM